MLSTLQQQKRIHWLPRVLGLCLGFTMTLPISDAFATTVSQPADLVGRTIVLDAGHGGPDTGARGATNVYEKDVTLPVTLKLATLLRQNGARVVLTREDDDDLATDRDRINKRRQRADLLGRLRIAQNANPDLFISIHCNASTSPAWHGAQALYMRGNATGKLAADTMQASFRENLLQTNRSAAAVSSLFLLKHVHAPATLVEIGFVSNPAEEGQLRTDAYQERVALAIYTGALEYFQQAPTGWKAYIESLLR